MLTATLAFWHQQLRIRTREWARTWGRLPLAGQLLGALGVGVAVILATVVLYPRPDAADLDQANFALSNWAPRIEDFAYHDGWTLTASASAALALGEGETIELLSSPGLRLPRGSYTLTLDYATSNTQAVALAANPPDDAFLRGTSARLPRAQTRASLDFETGRRVDGLRVTIRSDGQGDFTLTGATLVPNRHQYHRLLLGEIALLTAALVAIWARQRLSRHQRQTALLLAGITAIISLPLAARGLHAGHDLEVHLNRIEGLAHELAADQQFPVKISSWWIHGYGYPISIFYGDDLLYLPALLRLSGVPVISSYKIYILFINALTVVIAYSCFRRLFGSRRLGLLTTFAYVVSTYRLVDVYVRAAVGEYTALAFLPLLALSLSRLYTRSRGRPSAYLRDALLLTLGMTGLLKCHVLSTQMAVIFLAIIAVALLARTLTRPVLATLALAVALTAWLNLDFLVSWGDFYLHQGIQVQQRLQTDPPATIQASGAFLAQYFAWLQNPFGQDPAQVNERMSFHPGIVLTLAGLVGLSALGRHRPWPDRRLLAYVLLAGLALWLASDFFAWNRLAVDGLAGRYFAQVQFPWRYLGPASLFLALVLGELGARWRHSLPGSRKNAGPIITASCVATVVLFTSQYLDAYQSVNYYAAAELDSTINGGGEYMIAGSNKQDIDGRFHPQDLLDWSLLERRGTTTRVRVTTGTTPGSLEFPFYNYRGYQIRDETGRDFPILTGINNTLRTDIPADYQGELTVRFQPRLIWRLAAAGNLLGIIAVAVLAWSAWRRPEWWDRRRKLHPPRAKSVV